MVICLLAAGSRAFAVDPVAERRMEAFASARENIEVIIGIAPSIAPSLETERFQRELGLQLARGNGPGWQTTIRFQTLTLDRFELSADRLVYFFDPSTRQEDGSKPFDKTFVVVLSGTGSGTSYQVIEYDWFLESTSDVVAGTSSLRGFLASDLTTAIDHAYRRLMKLERGEGDQFVAVLKGGELVHEEAGDGLIKAGEFYAPVNFYLDRKGKLLNREFIPWTYLKVEQKDRSKVDGTVVSAYRGILSGRRRRVETYAYRLRANFPATEITFIRRDENKSRLAGYLVKTVPVEKPIKSEEEVVPQILQQGYTSRTGALNLISQLEQPIVTVNVISGESILAKVPLMVGSAKSVQLEVPNDLVRLGVEGDLQTLETELVDLVARRAVLMATARKAGKEGDLRALDEMETELKAFPTSRQLLQEITVVRVNSVNEALKQKNKAAATKVEKLCAAATELVEKHLDENVVLEFLAEIVELKKTIEAST